NFTDLSTNIPDTWSWYFPGADSTTATAENPMGICYSTAGTYDVTLVVSNTVGTDSITKSNIITVIICIPTAAFSTTIDTICDNVCVNYSDQSMSNPSTWAWSFPGGAPDTSNVQNPTGICYSSAGSYDVTLLVTNGLGSDTVTISNFMTVESCPPPVADFSASASTICIGECLVFSDLSTQNPDTWTWYFPGSDSATSSEQNPAGICYSTPGSYDVTLVVTNVNGSDSLTQTAYVTANSCLPSADFSSSVTTMCKSSCATFSDQSTGATSWAWSFPGANPDTADVQNPFGICYANPGTYDVILVVSNFSGSNTKVMTNYMTVMDCPQPVSDFTSSDTVVCAGECVTFTELSQDGQSWYWSFEGGTPSSSFAANPGAVCFGGPDGYHNVRLVVGNTWGSDTMNRSILVHVGAADMLISDTMYRNIPSTFVDNSNAPASWSWNFGDGSSTNLQSPTYAYSVSGNYTVTLNVTDLYGCTSFASKVVVVVDYTGQKELLPDQSLILYPNPATYMIYIGFSSKVLEPGWLEIENTLGELVYTDRNLSKVSTTLELNIGFLPSGIYYVKMGDGKNLVTNKFIKQ
ncbi:MAG: PKD domain-containing protein, partial [Flavobacteriales bacterium]|nr:PKD domain-containing protein [Flavobacteriales bacterium]